METFLETVANKATLTFLSTAPRLGSPLLLGGKAFSWALLELPSELPNSLLTARKCAERLLEQSFLDSSSSSLLPHASLIPHLSDLMDISRSPIPIVSISLDSSSHSFSHSFLTPGSLSRLDGLLSTCDRSRISKAIIRYVITIRSCAPCFSSLGPEVLICDVIRVVVKTGLGAKYSINAGTR